MTADGMSKSGMAGATYTAHFVQGERNKATGKLDSNISFYKVAIKYDANGTITAGTTVGKIRRETFMKETRNKDPEALLKPNK